MSATVYYEPYKLPAGILALVVHGVFFALLYFGFSWNRQFTAPATMSVELWASLPDEVAAPPANPKVEEAAPPPPKKIVEPDIVMPEKKKPVPKVVEAVKAKAKPKPATRKPAEPDTRIADQQAASAQAERIKQDEQATAIGRVVDEYQAKIQAKIRRNVVMPPGVANDAHGIYLVTLLPGGSVLNAVLKKSSGNAAYDHAVERAILKSDPLPLPPDAALFNRFREFDLVFKPTE